MLLNSLFSLTFYRVCLFLINIQKVRHKQNIRDTRKELNGNKSWCENMESKRVKRNKKAIKYLLWRTEFVKMI